MSKNFIDLTNKRFGKLVVKKKLNKNKFGFYLWLCQCDCGKEKITTGYDLRRGHTKSCGCYNLEKLEQTRKKFLTKHNRCRTKLYEVWCSMKRRCYNPKDKRYSCYGMRGIKVCDEWKNNFIPFYKWAIEHGYNENAKRGECTIDRINNDGNYCPENCRWITNKEQSINKRNCIYLNVNGKKMCFAEVCRLLEIPLKKAYNRRKDLKNNNSIYIFRDGKDIDKYEIKFLNNGEN